MLQLACVWYGSEDLFTALETMIWIRKKRKTFLSMSGSSGWSSTQAYEMVLKKHSTSHSQKQFFHNGLANNTNRLRFSLHRANLIFLIPLFNLNNHARGETKKNYFFSRISPSTWAAIDIRCGFTVLRLYRRRFYKSASISPRSFARSIKSNPDHLFGRKKKLFLSCYSTKVARTKPAALLNLDFIVGSSLTA